MEPEPRVNVLLVDDQPSNLVALSAILSPLGQNLVKANSGTEALKYLLSMDFAVILLDVMMPSPDGFETAALIRQREKSSHTPIIFITAMLNDEAHANRGYELGAVDYILKPFVPEILRSKVSVFIDLYRKTQAVKEQAERLREIEQRESQAKLAEAQQRLELHAYLTQVEQQVAQSITAHAPMGIVRCNEELSILEVNKTFAEAFAIDTKDVVHSNIVSALPWLPPALVQSLRNGEAFHIDKFEVQEAYPADKSRRYYDLAVWPVKSNHQKILGTILAAIDITERVLMDQQREDFVATLAHDLQTPVIASDRALEILLDRAQDKDPSFTSLLSMLRQNNQNLLDMIQSLLEVYRYEAGAQSLYFDQVDLKVLIENCINALKPMVENQGLELRAVIADDLRPAFADRTAMRRVITNLIHNSSKFTASGGFIEIRAGSDRRMLTIAVSDSGIGISPEHQSHLFERYWHGCAHTPSKDGSGLGLYLCAQIVKAHQGQISCTSEPGKLTTFTVQLPIVESGQNLPVPSGIKTVEKQT